MAIKLWSTSPPRRTPCRAACDRLGAENAEKQQPAPVSPLGLSRPSQFPNAPNLEANACQQPGSRL